MKERPPKAEPGTARYARLCTALARLGRLIGPSPSRTIAKAKRRVGGRKSGLDILAVDLELGGIPSDLLTVLEGARGAAGLAALAGTAVTAAAAVFMTWPAIVASVMMTLVCPLLCHRSVLGYPATAARRRAQSLLNSSAESVNLMVMGVRQNASLPRAVVFASSGESVFSQELRRCIWNVVTGTHRGFEEAVLALGIRWERFSSELKTSLNAIVVASHESTAEGRRRALDRANTAIVAGAKRRVEEYAISLSTPSMLLFGLGILLPIMVGSFMPMLSWDLWTGSTPDVTPADDGIYAAETVVVMDLVFPAIALLVAMDAVSRRPVDARRQAAVPGEERRWSVALMIGAAGLASAYMASDAVEWFPVILLAGVLPASAVLIFAGRRALMDARATEEDVQDLLFNLGAGMLDGENFESALHRSARDPMGTGRPLGRRLCLRAYVLGHGLEAAADSESCCEKGNALEALKVVAKASTKDEADAGMMAMDIAAYLRELSEIESTLKMRLRPTVSMMRMTAHALGPLVLGITYAIYVSLGSVAGDHGDAGASATMLMVLGLFLVEMNAVVCYFVWGIEGGYDRRVLGRSVGVCVLVSQLVFVSTAVIAG